MTPEGKVKKAIRAWLDARGFWQAGGDEPKEVRGWYYMPVPNGMGVSGIPDFVGSVVLRDGSSRPFAIEAKAPGGKVRPTQADRHVEMRAAGWLLYVCDDVSTLTELEAHLG